METGFRITHAKGFHMTFENGYTVSVQWGFGNYCSNHFNLKALDEVKRLESPDAEVAVWAEDGELINVPEFDIDQVGSNFTPEQVLELLNWAKDRDE